MNDTYKFRWHSKTARKMAVLQASYWARSRWQALKHNFPDLDVKFDVGAACDEAIAIHGRNIGWMSDKAYRKFEKDVVRDAYDTAQALGYEELVKEISNEYPTLI